VLGQKFQLVMTASTGELHTASGEWLSNVFLALAKFAVRRPKTRWVVKWLHFKFRHNLNEEELWLQQ
jgi:hypothetical protein